MKYCEMGSLLLVEIGTDLINSGMDGSIEKSLRGRMVPVFHLRTKFSGGEMARHASHDHLAVAP
jgi:hypothetical protein